MSGSALEVRSFFSKDRSLHRADLEADAAIDAGVEINPEELSALFVATLSGLNTSHRASIEAIGDAFADIGHDRVGHGAIQASWILVSHPGQAGALTALHQGFGCLLS